MKNSAKNSKIKLLVVFAVIMLVSVVGIFYVKNYMSYSTFKKSDAYAETVVTQKMFSGYTGQLKLYNYQGEEIPKNWLTERISKINQAEAVIVHLWASWCDPCINELPELIDYLKTNEKQIKSGELVIVLISLDYESPDITKFLKSFNELNNPDYFQIWDKNTELQKYLKIDRLPSTVIFYNNDQTERFLTVVDWKKFKLKF